MKKSRPKAVALIIDWNKQQIVANEFHEGEDCVQQCHEALRATGKDFTGCLKTVLANKAGRLHNAITEVKKLGLSAAMSDEELLKELEKNEHDKDD